MKILYALDAIVQRFLKGDLVIYPTESVYGIGCLPHATKALAMLRNLKQRPRSESWILLGSQLVQFEPYVPKSLLIEQKELLWQSRSLSSPVTWILPALPNLPEELRDGRGGLACRFSLHNDLVQLCNRLQQPIVSTSLNLRGEPPARTRQTVQKFLSHNSTICFWDRALGPAKRPSQIKNLLTGAILR